MVLLISFIDQMSKCLGCFHVMLIHCLVGLQFTGIAIVFGPK
jgi:hypothetical protein